MRVPLFFDSDYSRNNLGDRRQTAIALKTTLSPESTVRGHASASVVTACGQRFVLLALLFGLPAFSSEAGAAESGDAVVAARRALETAQLRLRLYEHDEYPRALHRLDRDIELAKAHVASYERRVKEYEQFDKFQHSSPLFLTLEEARLGLRQAELKLEELQEQRFLLTRHHSARVRLFALDVEAAQQSLRAAIER